MDKMPKLIYKGCDKGEETNPYITNLINLTPTLKQSYLPPRLWGSSGKLQTFVNGMMSSRPGLDLSHVTSKRVYWSLSDGTRLSYDVFEPSEEKMEGDEDITLVVCPGMCSSSEDLDYRVLAHLATPCGYRVAVLNQLGVLEKELTTPRIFNFGSTEEYGAMVRGVLETYPTTKLVAIGYSLGGNIVCKYLGENVQHQKPFICCISLCQMYNFNVGRKIMASKNYGILNKFFMKRISANVKGVVLRHWSQLRRVISARSRQRRDPGTSPTAPSKDHDPHHEMIAQSEYLDEIDEVINRRVSGHSSVAEYYDWASSFNYLDNIDIPMLLVNAGDDPLYEDEVYKPAVQKAKSHSKTLYVRTCDGGHLSFFTKTGRTHVDPIKWTEKMLMEYLNAVVNTQGTQHNGLQYVEQGSRTQCMKRPMRAAFVGNASSNSRKPNNLLCFCFSPLAGHATGKVAHTD